MKNQTILKLKVVVSRKKICNNNFKSDEKQILESIEVSLSDYENFMSPAVELIFSLLNTSEINKISENVANPNTYD